MAIRDYNSRVGVSSALLRAAPSYGGSVGENVFGAAAQVFAKSGADITKERDQQKKIKQNSAAIDAENTLNSAFLKVQERLSRNVTEGNSDIIQQAYSDATAGLSGLYDSGSEYDAVQGTLEAQAARMVVQSRVEENKISRRNLYDSVSARQNMRAEQFVGASALQKQVYLTEQKSDLARLVDARLITDDQAAENMMNFQNTVASNDIESKMQLGDFEGATLSLQSYKDDNLLTESAYTDLNAKITTLIRKEVDLGRKNAESLLKFQVPGMGFDASQNEVNDHFFKSISAGSIEFGTEQYFSEIVRIGNATGKVPDQFVAQMQQSLNFDMDEVGPQEAARALQVSDAYSVLPENLKLRVPQEVSHRADYMRSLTMMYGNAEQAARSLARAAKNPISMEKRESVRARIADLKVGSALGFELFNYYDVNPLDSEGLVDAASALVAGGIDVDTAARYALDNYNAKASDFMGNDMLYSPASVLPIENKDALEDITKSFIKEAWSEKRGVSGDKLNDYVDGTFLRATPQTLSAIREGRPEQAEWLVYTRVKNAFGGSEILSLNRAISFTREEMQAGSSFEGSVRKVSQGLLQEYFKSDVAMDEYLNAMEQFLQKKDK